MSCPYYEYKSGLFSGDYWCDKKDCAVNDDIYYQYCRNYDYSSCPIYKHTESSGCFLTTIVCNLLGKSDNDTILNDFRNFRNHILQKQEKYYDILKEYDTIGPVIKDAILIDSNRQIIANGIYQNGLLPIHHLIQQKNYDQAVENYYVMTLMLINYYGLKKEYNQLKDKNYYNLNFDPTKAGHGRRRTISNKYS